MTNRSLSLACLDLGSAAFGYQILSQLTRKGEVKVLEASAVDANRFVILVEGDETLLNESLLAIRKDVEATGPEGVLDQELVAKPHAQLLPSIYSLVHSPLQESLVVIETATASAMIGIAQAMLEGHQLQPIEIKVGRGLRGRGLGFFTGTAAHASAGAEEARNRLRTSMRAGRIEVIDNPSPSFRHFFD